MYYVIASGKKKSKIGKNAIENVIQKLNDRKVEYTLMISQYPGHSVELAKEASLQKDCTAIIAVGGDGTFYEVLNGMDTTKIPIGLIPAGTGNDFARTLGIGSDIDQCLDNILNQEPVYIDYLKTGVHKSFNVVGTGFDILLLEKEAELRKTGKYSDRKSYNKALLDTVFHCQFQDLTFRIDDGEEIKENMFLMEVCNGKWGGGKLPLCFDADPHDGIIDFIIIKKFSKWKLPFLLLKFKAGKIPNTKYYLHYRCKKVEIDIEPKLKANLDGELMPLFPLTVEIVHNELKYFPSLIPARDPYVILKDKNSI